MLVCANKNNTKIILKACFLVELLWECHCGKFRVEQYILVNISSSDYQLTSRRFDLNYSRHNMKLNWNIWSLSSICDIPGNYISFKLWKFDTLPAARECRMSHVSIEARDGQIVLVDGSTDHHAPCTASCLVNYHPTAVPTFFDFQRDLLRLSLITFIVRWSFVPRESLVTWQVPARHGPPVCFLPSTKLLAGHLWLCAVSRLPTERDWER